MKQSVRVLVVDDSALMRKLLPQIIESDGSIQVVGTAMDGEFAMKKIEELRPDVITLDLEMPRMDGMETLKQITRRYPTPVIVVSAHTTDGAAATFRALNQGAFDFVAKPKDALSAHMEEITRDLITKIRAAAMSRLVPKREIKLSFERVHKASKIRPLAKKIVAIGISTGGPNSLQYVLSQLPADFPAAILIVQHMPEGFTELFARRLDECCAVDVKEAQTGDLLLAGRVLIAPGNKHLKVRRMPQASVAILNDDAHVNGHRPSADVLFYSVAAEFGSDAVGVLMTGMGEDGAEGLGAMRRAGAVTIAQDEQSSVVFGMPRAAIERGHAMRVVSLDAMANTLQVNCASEKTRTVTKV